jgi:peptide/nickel transport system permease protein
MMRFVLYRLLRSIPAVWAIASIVFLLSRALPSDNLLGQSLSEGNLNSRALTPAAREATIHQIRQRLGLTGPLFYFSWERAASGSVAKWHWHGTVNQYHQWLRNALQGDLGTSYRDGQPVATVLSEALRHTVPLTICAALLTIGLALFLGLWLASGKSNFLMTALYGIDALPLFVVALGLLLLLANPDILPLFPAYGSGQNDDVNASWLAQLSTYFYYGALPLTSLVLVKLPSLVMQLHDALRHELMSLYAITARAKGLSDWQVLTRHALRNALLPIITLLTDLLPALVAGAVVVEVIFARPGMGRLLAEAAANHDFPVLVGGVLLIASMRLLGLLVADALYFVVDPRIRLHG